MPARWRVMPPAARTRDPLVVTFPEPLDHGLLARALGVTVEALAFASGHAVPWLIAYATVAMNWWWMLAHVGGVIASALMTPARAAAIFGVELFGILAFFALQRIAGAGRFGDAQV